tara:strand:+ start:819 stop:1397 length:579 start_codon:yes stop_codon:yes gene_type:complete
MDFFTKAIGFVSDGITSVGDFVSEGFSDIGDFLFGDDQGMDDIDSGGFFSDVANFFTGDNSGTSGSFLDQVNKLNKKRSQKGGTSALDVYNAKQLTQLRRLSSQRAKQEAAKNLQRELAVSTQKNRDDRERFRQLAKLPIRRALEMHGASAINRYNMQLKRNGMSPITDESVPITTVGTDLGQTISPTKISV